MSSSNITSGFIDIATFDEIEKYMYGGPSATAYFVREVRKSTWFTQVPVQLSKFSGTPGFGQEWSVSISRAGDYLLHAWLRVNIPQVRIKPTNSNEKEYSFRWTKNLMHNLIREATLTFNDLVAARFDNYYLDFWASFTTPSGKRNGYRNMIGNTNTLIYPVANATNGSTVNTLGLNEGGTFLNLPLPFFFARDSGVALPTAALPYNEMQINFNFRNWDELLIMTDMKKLAAGTNPYEQIVVGTHIESVPVLGSAQVWANYAIVSNEERRRMGCAIRDILIEQVQTSPRQNFNPVTNPTPSYDIRFSHAVKWLGFGVRNTTGKAEWSNYSTASPIPSITSPSITYEPSGAFDPIDNTALIYENTNRLGHMGSDYFSLINPWYHAPNIPQSIGIHLYSYSLFMNDLDPMGSTNYGKLTNVSIVPESSPSAAKAASGGGIVGSGNSFPQTFEFFALVTNHNVIRISGGALGFPVL